MSRLRRITTRTTDLASDTGAAAVEFALVLLPLLLILFGIIDFGRAYNTQLSLSAAAREGAREMALHNNPVAARAAVRGATTDLTPTVTDAQITITPSTCTAGASVTIRVTRPLSSLSGFFTELFEGESLRGVGVMKCNG